MKISPDTGEAVVLFGEGEGFLVRHWLRIIFLAILTVMLSSGVLAPAKVANAGTDDYPYRNAVSCGTGTWCVNGRWYSDWGFAYRNCTDWVAWRMRNTNSDS